MLEWLACRTTAERVRLCRCAHAANKERRKSRQKKGRRLKLKDVLLLQGSKAQQSTAQRSSTADADAAASKKNAKRSKKNRQSRDTHKAHFPVSSVCLSLQRLFSHALTTFDPEASLSCARTPHENSRINGKLTIARGLSAHTLASLPTIPCHIKPLRPHCLFSSPSHYLERAWQCFKRQDCEQQHPKSTALCSHSSVAFRPSLFSSFLITVRTLAFVFIGHSQHCCYHIRSHSTIPSLNSFGIYSYIAHTFARTHRRTHTSSASGHSVLLARFLAPDNHLAVPLRLSHSDRSS